MFRVVSKTLVATARKSFVPSVNNASAFSVRRFGGAASGGDPHSDEGYGTRTIPRDVDQQGGRRGEEIAAELVGESRFCNDPIVPPNAAGTKENPIIVPSQEHSRPVGFEDPVTGQLQWFNLHDGPLHYIPDIGLYFKLNHLH